MEERLKSNSSLKSTQKTKLKKDRVIGETKAEKGREDIQGIDRGIGIKEEGEFKVEIVGEGLPLPLSRRREKAPQVVLVHQNDSRNN